MDGSIQSEPNYQGPDIKCDFPGEAKPGMLHVDNSPFFARRIFDKLGRSALIVNKLDYYANAIPIGAFCNALAFITYGFYRCRVYDTNETFLWAVMFTFGAIGQLTAGFLEWIKGRTFPATLYLTLGAYCLTHYFIYILPRKWIYDENPSLGGYNYLYSNHGSLCVFYSGLTCLGFALLLFSFRSNIWFILQCLTTLAFFIVRAIGEGQDCLGVKKNAAGILEAIAGFFSLLVGISQLVNNEAMHSQVFPVCPMADDNEIDVPAYAAPVNQGYGGY